MSAQSVTAEPLSTERTERTGAEPTGAEPTAVYLGHVFHIAGAIGEAGYHDAAERLVSLPDGALVVEAGRVAWCGPAARLPAAWAALEPVRTGFILPGFVDAHLHFPQTYTTGAYGGGKLLDWLDRITFPAEARLADAGFAERIAADFTRRRIAVGTTAAMVFGSAFPHAQDALFAASLAAGLRTVSGRGIQTVGPESAAALLTGEQEAIELTTAELARWHGAGTGDPATALVHGAVVPRFSLSVTPATFAALGELYAEWAPRGAYFHSHVSENATPVVGEIDQVLAAYGTKTYLDTYDGRFLPGSKRGGASLLGRRSILAHGVHLHDAELARLAETGSSIAHCPGSQQFIGSGTMPWRRTLASGVTVALGSDIGGGYEWSIAQTAAEAYRVHLSEPGEASVALHPAELLFGATLAGARALDQEARFGSFEVGKEADFLLIDPDRWEPLALVLAGGIRAEDAREAEAQTLFSLLFHLREPAIAGVYVQGRRVTAPVA